MLLLSGGRVKSMHGRFSTSVHSVSCNSLRTACYAQFQLHVFIAEEYQSSFVCLQLSLFILFCAKTLTTFKINEEKCNRSILNFLRVKFLSIITD